MDEFDKRMLKDWFAFCFTVFPLIVLTFVSAVAFFGGITFGLYWLIVSRF